MFRSNAPQIGIRRGGNGFGYGDSEAFAGVEVGGLGASDGEINQRGFRMGLEIREGRSMGDGERGWGFEDFRWEWKRHSATLKSFTREREKDDKCRWNGYRVVSQEWRLKKNTQRKRETIRVANALLMRSFRFLVSRVL